jgi:hypothetical protein
LTKEGKKVKPHFIAAAVIPNQANLVEKSQKKAESDNLPFIHPDYNKNGK